VKYLLIGFVRVWRAVISPLYGDVCKYYPSCSAYGLEALRVHGAIKGTYLMVNRIIRCNPWSTGGIDPVPGSALEAEIAAERLAEAADLAQRRDAQERGQAIDLLLEQNGGSMFVGVEPNVSRETLVCC
jgi:putative membrane protein insertion efficiency factor